MEPNKIKDKKTEDRRIAARFVKNFPVRFCFEDNSSAGMGHTENISKSGALVDIPLEEYRKCTELSKDRISLDIDLIDTLTRVRPIARVAWKTTDLDKQKVNIGLEFIDFPKIDRSLYDKYITSLSGIKERVGGFMRIRKISFEDKYLTDRERRNLQILDIIRKKGPISRTEISHATGINIVTVSNYVDNYIKIGLVIEGGLDVSTGGRRPELIELNPNFGYIVGVDFGMLGVENPVIDIVLTDLNAKIITKTKDFRSSDKLDDNLDLIGKAIEKVINESGIDRSRLLGIGVALAGIIDKEKQTIRDTNNDTTQDYSDFIEKLNRNFDVPVAVENDHFAAVLAEKYVGITTGKDFENLIFMASDCACGIIIKGQVYKGISQSAGELSINPPNVEESKSSKAWCQFEDSLRSRGLDLSMVRSAKQLFRSNKEAKSKILKLASDDIDKINFDIIVEAVKSQDKIALQLVEEAGEYMGAKIAFLVNLLNPEIVIIGRYIDKLGDPFLNAVIKSTRRWAFQECFNSVRIILTSLGDESVALGAATLIMQESFKYANV